MKPTELRLGNLIKVKELNLNNGNYEWETQEVTYHVLHSILAGNRKGFEPIPIAEEWLLRFGFEKINEPLGYHFENKDCWIYLIGLGFEIEINTLDERHNLCRSFLYVHQLQNLYFALTGNELTIKL